MNFKLFSNKTALTFMAIGILAFGLRFFYLKQTASFIQSGPGSDSYFYLEWAKDIVRGNILGNDVFYALPVYPYFLSLVYLCSGAKVNDILLLQITIGCANCGLIYLLGNKLFNRPVGLIAGILACFYTMFIFYDRMLLPVCLAINLGLLLFLILLVARDSAKLSDWLAVGLLLGLCTLTYASFTVVVLLILFWIIYEYRKPVLRRACLYCLALLMPWCCIVGLATLRNYVVAADPALITAHSGINFYIGNNPQANGLFKLPLYMRSTQNGHLEDARLIAQERSGRRLKPSEVSSFWFKQSLSFIAHRPVDYLKLLGKKFALFWNAREYIDEVEYYLFSEQATILKLPLFSFALIAPLGILGMFLSWPLRKQTAFLYLFVIAFMLGAISFFINARYRLAVVPYLIIFAAAGLWQISLDCQKKRYKKALIYFILFLSLCYLVNLPLTYAPGPLNFTFLYNKGVYSLEQNDLAQARQYFQEALKINPVDFMSYFGLGNVYYRMNQLPDAEKYFKKSLVINPYYYDAHFNLGLIYKQLADYPQATRHFLLVLNLNPDDSAAHYNLGQVYQQQGLVELALEQYEIALTSDPTQQQVLEALGQINKGSR